MNAHDAELALSKSQYSQEALRLPSSTGELVHASNA
jgi:hypothetical protein